MGGNNLLAAADGPNLSLHDFMRIILRGTDGFMCEGTKRADPAALTTTTHAGEVRGWRVKIQYTNEPCIDRL